MARAKKQAKKGGTRSRASVSRAKGGAAGQAELAGTREVDEDLEGPTMAYFDDIQAHGKATRKLTKSKAVFTAAMEKKYPDGEDHTYPLGNGYNARLTRTTTTKTEAWVEKAPKEES